MRVSDSPYTYKESGGLSNHNRGTEVDPLKADDHSACRQFPHRARTGKDSSQQPELTHKESAQRHPFVECAATRPPEVAVRFQAKPFQTQVFHRERERLDELM